MPHAALAHVFESVLMRLNKCLKLDVSTLYSNFAKREYPPINSLFYDQSNSKQKPEFMFPQQESKVDLMGFTLSLLTSEK